MTIIKKFVSVFLLLIFAVQGVALAEVQIVKKDPMYKFTSASGRSPQLMYFDTLDEAFAEVKARYASWNTNIVHYEISNLRGEYASPNYNGLPLSYMWDVSVTSDGRVNISTSREITRYGYCEQESNITEGENEWILYLNGNSLWCEKQIPVPLNVAPIASTQNSCTAARYTDFWGKYADGGMVGAPIVVPAGEKIRTELDYPDGGVGTLGVERYFRSRSIKLPLMRSGLTCQAAKSGCLCVTPTATKVIREIGGLPTVLMFWLRAKMPGHFNWRGVVRYIVLIPRGS